MGPGSDPKGPWVLWPQYLAGNSRQLGSTLNAFYEGLASCRGVSEGATAPYTLKLQGGMKFAKWHLGFMKVVRELERLRLIVTDMQDIEEAHTFRHH